MAVLVNNHGHDDTASWQQALQIALPTMSVLPYPQIPNPDDIKYAAVWQHPHADLLRYKNLKAVLVLGAGMDHIDQAPMLPNVPIVRLVDPAVGADMSQYVLYWVMHFQRGYETYRQQQAERRWQRYEYPLASGYQVSVLGAGAIATCIAEFIASAGFKVCVWSRSQRKSEHSGVDYYSGSEGLDSALMAANVLVNCLPLKPQTSEFINATLLAKLPKGASLINVSRGGVVNESDLLAALQSGHLASAALDTVATEPMSEEHPFWSQRNIHLTPHISGATYTRTAAQVVADNILRIEAGEAPFPIYKPTQQ